MIMKLSLLTLTALCIGANAFAGEAGEADGAGRTLVVYFSRTNNTRIVAEQIHGLVGGDLFRVVPKTPYPEDYRETTRIARAELDNDARPEVAETIPVGEMDKYDVIFLGYPIWWGTMPMAYFTFLEQYDFSGKTVIPFCTHGGSGLGRSTADIARLCPGATIREGLAIRGASAGQAGDDVADWLRKLGYP